MESMFMLKRFEQCKLEFKELIDLLLRSNVTFLFRNHSLLCELNILETIEVIYHWNVSELSTITFHFLWRNSLSAD